MEEPSQDRAHIYLVVSRNYLITCDICDTISDFDPVAEISVQEGHEHALVTITPLRRIAVAFVEAGSEQVTKLKIDQAVQGRGGRLVLMGNAAEDELDGHSPRLRWPVLARPVSTRMILKQLALPQHSIRSKRCFAGLR
ncbi:MULTISPECIES: hypothetical protein [unclassified Leisingera]|uniref:hypothetical protein n=1 Tax=unclassified Leisingera TaxID=2614906 RepID=UPI00057CE29B|nr:MULTISPECIES: hypothetical protein [unclassified Leisingera]KIC30607.1 hypothetical protein RA24_02425 [Leisingera sp. ANG-M6]KIC32236.1 hypothetical protein RA25_12390 [Leisingera sp. ANG-S5]